MSAPVEASSLSSLANLFANPPQYPRNPTHKVHEPLVLYIVRVPGSQDVFLTPLKPPTKASISLEAIQSSLYYLHVETPEDDTIRQSFEAEREAEQRRSRAPSVLRKPLPPTPFANFPASLRPGTPPKSYPHFQPGEGDSAGQLHRYVSRGSHLRLNLGRTNSVPRKQLEGRPLPSQQSLQNEDTPEPTQEPAPGVKDTRRWSAPDKKPTPWVPRLQVPEHDQLGTVHEGQGSIGQEDNRRPARQISPAKSRKITLIRRDPTSGTQWNVGSITATERKSSMALLQPVEVVLTSPGYTRFAMQPDSPLKLDNLRQSGQSYSPSSPSPSSATGSEFRRRVSFRPLPDEHKLSLQHVRTNSSDVLGEMTNGAPRKLQQVYAFTSPWQGVCAFSNGVDGKSLRCRHSLPTTSSVQGETSLPVAEIRFNLPWSLLRMKDPNKQKPAESDKLPISQLMGKSAKEQWRRSVQGFKHHSWQGRSDEEGNGTVLPSASQSSNKDDNYRISLKLGREKAGGGFKGNSAKLGKLIVENEGLKMCDLVVASCMGLWWQHYLEGSS